MGSGGVRFLGVVLLLITCGFVGLQSCSFSASAQADESVQTISSGPSFTHEQ